MIGDRLRLAAHGVEDAIDGRIAEANAEAERGGDGDKQREYDQQRVHVQPAFPLMQLPFVMSYLHKNVCTSYQRKTLEITSSFPHSRWSATLLARRTDRN